jgi:hypothetical protein
VARQLAIPEGTLSSRLAAAHKKLAWRLTRFGLSFSGASLGMLLAENAASACGPSTLLFTTIRAAMLLTAGQVVGVSAGVITLTEGVLRTMFIAKLKTATVFMCGVAALGLGTGGLLYQTQAGAADSPRPGQKRIAVQGVAQGARVDGDDEEARQEKDRAKLATEEARLRASLSEEKEKARREEEMQRDRAEAQRRAAEDALRQLKEQLAKAQEAERLARQQAEAQEAEIQARQRAEAQEAERRARQQAETQERLARQQAKAQEEERRARRQAENNRQSGPDFDRKPEEQGLNRLAELEAKVREEINRQRQALMEQMKKLETQEREALQKLEIERSRLVKERPDNQASPAGDKLDRILERLDRMERRLEKLERGSTSSGGRK